MFGLAAHEDLIGLARYAHGGVAGQTVPEGHVGVQFRAVLIEHRHLKAGAKGHGALIRFHLTDQQFEEGRLACPVRPDKGHAVPAHDAQIKGAQDRAVAKGFGDSRGLNHAAARFRTRGQRHFGGALAFDHAGAVGAHGL